MEMGTSVLGSLIALGYEGILLEETGLLDALTHGASNQEFTQCCTWLVSNLKTICHLEEDVSTTCGPEDADNFQLEMSGVLSELYCPYPQLITGSVTSRLTSRENCEILLAFLCTELQAARLLFRRQDPHPPKQSEEKNNVCEELLLIGEALGIPPDPDTPVLQFFTDAKSKISEMLPVETPGYLMNPLLKTQLEPTHWEKLAQIHQTLRYEYECRMRMLITRFDVTVTSFHWSERAEQGKGEAMEKLFSPLRQMMHAESHVTLAHLLAAREDTSRIVKTSSGSSRLNTSSSINKVLMGSVPDRGGRPGEIEPPMPMWEKRREGGGRGDYGRGGGRPHGKGKRSKKKP